MICQIKLGNQKVLKDIENKKNYKNNYSSIINNDFASTDYLYPNGHRMTHQMRWYKGSRDRGLNSDMAA